MSRSIRRAMIDRDHQQLSLVRQCILLDVSRASVYYRSVPTRAEDLELMVLMDRQYLKAPFYGSRKMKAWLLQQGYLVSRKRVRRLMRLMGLEAINRRPNTSKPAPGHRIFPYLLKGVEVNRVDQVWAADITYIPMAKGFLYLVAIMDWHSRHVLAWKLSNTMDTSFCVAALEEALGKGRPEIFNTDQGSQFTSEAFTQTLQEQRVQVSMDGKGRYLDNIFVERLWRSIKYEEVYLKAYQTVAEARTGINAYLEFYNRQRPHQALGYRTPAEVYQHGQEERGAAAEEAGLLGDERLLRVRACPTSEARPRWRTCWWAWEFLTPSSDQPWSSGSATCCSTTWPGRCGASPSTGTATTRSNPSTSKTLRPRRWRLALKARAPWPTLPGRTLSPSRRCFACWPPRWASEGGSYTRLRAWVSP